MRDRFIKKLTEKVEKDPKITLVTGDLGFGVFDSFRKDHAGNFINAGVAEQNMTLVASGLAKEGFKVFTYSIANFPTLRCLEMIRNDCAYHGLDVKVVAVGAGMSYGALGISHHATEDIAIMRAVPDVSVFSPGNLTEVDHVVTHLVATGGTCYLRLDKDKGAEPEQEEPISIGAPRLLRHGGDVLILATGGITSEAVKARELLHSEGIQASVASVHTIKPINEAAMVALLKDFSLVVTVEEHSLTGGLGSIVAEVLVDNQLHSSRLLRLGIKPCFTSVVGSQDYLRGIYEINAPSIRCQIAKAFKK